MLIKILLWTAIAYLIWENNINMAIALGFLAVAAIANLEQIVRRATQHIAQNRHALYELLRTYAISGNLSHALLWDRFGTILLQKLNLASCLVAAKRASQLRQPIIYKQQNDAPGFCQFYDCVSRTPVAVHPADGCVAFVRKERPKFSATAQAIAQT